MEVILMAPSLPFERMDDFKLISMIQESPFSLTALGFQESLNRVVFLKLLKPTIKDQSQWLERFTREAQVCAQLKNPHIVDVYLIGEHQGYTYIAMEYIHGLSLKNILSHEQKLSAEISFSILLQILSALEYIHQKGIVHRDIKPGNIMVDISGIVRLTDFGLAYLGEDTSVTQAGTILGTPAYMSPEQILGERVLPQSDFFSLGSTLYEMLTGEKAFSGNSYSVCIQKILNETPTPPSRLVKNLFSGIDAFIFGLLEKKASSRPAAVTDILKKLAELKLNYDTPAWKHTIGNLVQKYYLPPPKLPRISRKEEPPKITGEKIRKKNIFTNKWIIFSLIFLIGLITVMLRMVGNDRDLLSNTNSLNKTDSLMGVNGSELDAESNGITSPKDTASRMLRSEKGKGQESPSLGQSDLTKRGSDHSTARISENTEKTTEISRTEVNNPLPATIENSIVNLEIIPWGGVSLNGQLIDSLIYRKEIVLTPGEHQIILSHPEFPPKLINLQIAPAETVTVSYSFLESSGYLHIEARPWAEVYIDGKYIDTTPFRRPMILSAGEHFLDLRHPSYASWRQIVTITVNETLRIKKNFTEKSW